MGLGKMVGDSRVAALASSWGALHKRLGTTPSLGPPRGCVEILHHLSQAHAGPQERQAAQSLAAVAAALLRDLAQSAPEARVCFAKKVILLPVHRAGPHGGAPLTSSNLPTKLLFSSLRKTRKLRLPEVTSLL